MTPAVQTSETETALDAALGVAGVNNGGFSRARHIAFAALADLHPDLSLCTIAESLGYHTPDTARIRLAQVRKAGWWKEIYVDEVVGVIVAPQYGERAA
jgi:hypothetical protein